MDRWVGSLSRREGTVCAGESVAARPDPRLAAYVFGYAGARFPDAGPSVRRIAPIDGIKVILDFENLDRRMLTTGGRGRREPSSPVVGLQSGPLVFEQSGIDHGMVIGLTPLGAHALFGMPLKELPAYAGITELLGTHAAHLVEQLAETPGWAARFALLDRWLSARLHPGARLATPVQATWDLLSTTHGRPAIAAVADQVGWSRSHLEARFHAQIGIPPKTFARIVRFHHALRLLARHRPPSRSDIAALCGYADQSHFNREFRALTGCAPTRFLALASQET
ncbi:helix-turn-helix transcriptional regulator [Amycolatopsis sp. NPDC059021]|uniref:helix-turn-helix transcriptional regulator n=1 Tax=Amycolatopsis sp. NPDC059021 TaxID=3346704 RepID=UPI00366F314A